MVHSHEERGELTIEAGRDGRLWVGKLGLCIATEKRGGVRSDGEVELLVSGSYCRETGETVVLHSHEKKGEGG